MTAPGEIFYSVPDPSFLGELREMSDNLRILAEKGTEGLIPSSLLWGSLIVHFTLCHPFLFSLLTRHQGTFTLLRQHLRQFQNIDGFHAF